MISPAPEARGSSLPSTAHSISRAWSTPASMMTLRSYCSASVMAASSWSAVRTFEMPTLEPRLAGFTNSGRPSASARWRTDAGSCRQSKAVQAHQRVCGSPWASNTCFISTLSIPTADAATPGPT